MRENRCSCSIFQGRAWGTRAFHRCFFPPWFLLAAIVMITGGWSLPNDCYGEEPSPPATSGSPVVSGPSTTPVDIMPTESPAPAKALDDPMMETTRFVSVGALYLGADYSQGVIMMTELEKKLRRRFAVFARLGRIEYWPDRAYDGYGEGGRGEGFELGWRVYPVLREGKSFYFGAGLGYWRLDEYWNTTRKSSFVMSGRRHARFEHAQIHAGWKFAIGRGTTYLNPMVQSGNFHANGDDTVYVSAGIALGTAW